MYNLRSRIVEENSSNDLQLTPPKMNLNDSLDEACGEELLTMSTPEEFKEVTIEALNELIKKLQVCILINKFWQTHSLNNSHP